MSEFNNFTLAKRFRALEASETFAPYSGVELIIDEEHSAFAGNRSGRVLTATNPWATQALAARLLARIQGYQYQPYSAKDALLDPAAELGDGVSLNGLYGGVFSITRKYNRLMPADISAPEDEEIDHEYPFKTKTDRAVTRRFSALRAELSMQAGEIAAKVSGEGGDASSVAWSLTSQAWTVKANGKEVFRIDKNGATVTGKITATSGAIGGFDIEKDSITYNRLTWGGNKSGVYLGTKGLQLGSTGGSYFQASASGEVKAHNITLTGTLKVGGKTITAAALQSGAQSAYNNGAAWTTGAGNGNSAMNILNGHARCKTLSADGVISAYGALNAYGGFTMRDGRGISHNVSLGSIVDGNGETQYVLRWS